MGLLILDIQHTGKPHVRDRGAGFDIDGDGVVEGHEYEALLTPVYAGAAEDYANAKGHETAILLHGKYSDRHARANAMARARPHDWCLYVACHLNAGGGDYGLVLHDERSGLGRGAAKDIVEAMRPYWTANGVRTLAPQETAYEHPLWPRPYRTISGIYEGPGNITGLCFEPLFIDSHAHMLRGNAHLEQIGVHLAKGFDAWVHRKTAR